MKRGEEAIDVGVHVDSHALNESFPMVKETFYNNNKTTRNIPFPFAIDILKMIHPLLLLIFCLAYCIHMTHWQIHLAMLWNINPSCNTLIIILVNIC